MKNLAHHYLADLAHHYFRILAHHYLTDLAHSNRWTVNRFHRILSTQVQWRALGDHNMPDGYNPDDFGFDGREYPMDLIGQSLKTIVWAVAGGFPRTPETIKALESLKETREFIQSAKESHLAKDETVLSTDQLTLDLHPAPRNDLRFPSFIHIRNPEVGF